MRIVAGADRCPATIASGPLGSGPVGKAHLSREYDARNDQPSRRQPVERLPQPHRSTVANSDRTARRSIHRRGALGRESSTSCGLPDAFAAAGSQEGGTVRPSGHRTGRLYRATVQRGSRRSGECDGLRRTPRCPRFLPPQVAAVGGGPPRRFQASDRVGEHQ